MKDILLLQDIKDQYYSDLAHSGTVRMELEDYIREFYVQVYDAQLNFIGYERS